MLHWPCCISITATAVVTFNQRKYTECGNQVEGIEEVLFRGLLLGRKNAIM